MGACCGKPVEGRKEGWGPGVSGRASAAAGSTVGSPVLAFVGLNGSGKSALLHTLQQRDGVKIHRAALETLNGGSAVEASGSPPSPLGDAREELRGPEPADPQEGFTLEVQEGVLCAPPPTTSTTVHRLRAAGVAFTAVDVPGDRRRMERDEWRLAVEGHGTTAVVYVVDAADELRMPVAREELWSLCVPDGAGFLGVSGGGDLPREGRRPDGGGGGGGGGGGALLRGRRLVVLASKQDVEGAVDVEEVAEAMDLERLRTTLETTGGVVVECAACSATVRASVEAALAGALGRRA